MNISQIQELSSPDMKTVIDRVGRFCSQAGIRLPTLRRVISAGAPVQARVIERFAGLLVIGDIKRGDIGSTMDAYADYLRLVAEVTRALRSVETAAA